jgi:hypothetical protein
MEVINDPEKVRNERKLPKTGLDPLPFENQEY